MGINRKIDSLGRFVPPKSARDLYGYEKGSRLHFYTLDNSIFVCLYGSDNVPPRCVDTGIIHKMDTLGRIVIPKELLNEWNMHDNEKINISIMGNGFLLSKEKHICLCCGNFSDNLNHHICPECVGEIINEDKMSTAP